MIVHRPTLAEATGRADLPPLDDRRLPWFVMAFMAVAGWLASLCFLAVLGLLGVFEGLAGALFVGIGLMAGASLLQRRTPDDAVFPNQLGLAGMITGEVIVVVTVLELLDRHTPLGISAVIAVVSLIALVAFADSFHRFLATIALGLSVAGVGHELVGEGALHVAAIGSYGLGLAVLHAEPRIEAAAPGLRAPVGHGVLLVAGVILVGLLGSSFAENVVVTGVGLAVVTLAWLFGAVLPELGIRSWRVKAPLAGLVAVLSALTAATPGVLPSLAVMGLGFQRRSPMLFGGATLWFGGFLVFTYYDLDLGLDTKAGLLMATGVLVLGAQQVLRRVR